MCTVSMIMDHYQQKWTPFSFQVPPVQITAEEIAEFRELLERAREYDKRNYEPDCELDEKRKALKTLATQLGVDISFIDRPEVGE